jgi:hypothetical protein
VERPLHVHVPPLAARLTLPVPWRRLLALLKTTLALSALCFWFVALRPQLLGGPAQYGMVAGTSMLPTPRMKLASEFE